MDDDKLRNGRIPLSRIKVNPWKKKISGETQNADRLVYLKESISNYGAWQGAVGRIVDSHGNLARVPVPPDPLCLDNGQQVQLGNFTHRYWQMLETHGPDFEIIVGLGNFDNIDMLRILAMSNYYKDFEHEEVVRIISFAKEILTKYPQRCARYAASADLQANCKSFEPTAGDISVFLGEKNWPKRRVSELTGKFESTPTETSETSVVCNDESTQDDSESNPQVNSQDYPQQGEQSPVLTTLPPIPREVANHELHPAVIEHNQMRIATLQGEFQKASELYLDPKEKNQRRLESHFGTLKYLREQIRKYGGDIELPVREKSMRIHTKTDSPTMQKLLTSLRATLATYEPRLNFFEVEKLFEGASPVEKQNAGILFEKLCQLFETGRTVAACNKLQK